MKRIIMLAALLLGGLTLTLPATASTTQVPTAVRAIEAQSHPLPQAKRNTTYNVCLRNDTDLCWDFNGAGSQITLGGGSTITLLSGPNGGLEFQNAGGHCAYVSGNAGYPLDEANNACSGTDSQNFTANYHATYYINTRKTGPDNLASVMAFNNAGGKPIWVNFQSGWAEWICIANGLQYVC